jgi:hypothetical protein
MSGESVDGVNTGAHRDRLARNRDFTGAVEIWRANVPSAALRRWSTRPSVAMSDPAIMIAPSVTRLIAFQSTRRGLNPCSSYLSSAKRLAEIAPLGLGRSNSIDCGPFSTTIERKPIPRTCQPSFS